MMRDPKKRIIFFLIIFVLNFVMIHTINAVKRGNQKKKQVDMYQQVLSNFESQIVDSIQTRRAASYSGGGIENEFSHSSMTDCMENRTIPAQVLYENELLTVEVTGIEVKTANCTINLRYTNHSEHLVTVQQEGNTYINKALSSLMIYSKYDIKPGEAEDCSIFVSREEIPFYDFSFEELEFCLAVINQDEPESSGPYENTTLLTTDPIIIRTEPADQKEVRSGLVMDEEMKTLYETDEVKVTRIGLFDQLFYRNGKPNPKSFSFWAFLVENRTDHDMVIDGVHASVNGINTIPFGDLVISAGKRPVNRLKLYEAESSDEEMSTEEGKSDSLDLTNRRTWLLEDIDTSSIEFDLIYTDHAGKEKTVRLKDEYEFSNKENPET